MVDLDQLHHCEIINVTNHILLDVCYQQLIQFINPD